METKINKYTRKWLGFLSGLSDVALNSRQAKLKLPLKSIVEEFKSGKSRLQIMLDDSKDEVIKTRKPTLKAGKKWKIRDSMRSDKDNLAFKEIIGHTQTERKVSELMKSNGGQILVKKTRDIVIQNVSSEFENKGFLKGVQQAQQGQWTKWEGTLHRTVPRFQLPLSIYGKERNCPLLTTSSKND